MYHNDYSHRLSSEQQRRKISTNAKFDRMMETMSSVSVHTSKKRRLSAREEYSPRKSSSLGLDLSFIKMARDRDEGSHLSSEGNASKASHVSSCKPLPSWLANTFMSLSHTNPLRFLLPPRMRTPPEISSFAMPSSEGIIIPDNELSSQPYYVEEFENSDEAVPPDCLPFSTPGPGRSSSLLGSTIISSAMPLFHSPRTNSSVTLCQLSNALGPNQAPQPLPDAHTSTFSDRYLPEEYTDGTSSDQQTLDSTYNASFFSDIFSTPGPVYRNTYSEHFDCPVEDPLESDYQRKLKNISHDDIDFQWKPFNRKTQFLPTAAKRVSFACDKSSDIDAWNPYDSERPRALETQDETCTPASPSPFRFFPPPEPDLLSEAPEQEVKDQITLSTKPSVPVAGTSNSPLQNGDTTSSEGSKIEKKKGFVPPYQFGWGENNLSYNESPSAISRTGVLNEESKGKTVYSQESNDSIESWNCT